MFECPECGDFFDEFGGPVYECSRCGGTQVEERRCEECNIFMAKVADQSCLSCEAGLEEEPEKITVYETPDGEHHHTEAEAEQWIIDEPERERKAIENKARTEALMERMRRESIEEGIKLLPVLRDLNEKMPEGFARIGGWIERELEDLERELNREDEEGGRFVSSKYLQIDIEELILLLFPGQETETEIELSNDYINQDWTTRRRIGLEFQKRLEVTLGEMFGEDHEWSFSHYDLGSAFLSDAKVAAPMLIKVIERFHDLTATESFVRFIEQSEPTVEIDRGAWEPQVSLRQETYEGES